MPDEASDVAVLFADVSGSTKLYETVGDADALEAIGRCLSLVRIACEGQGGRVVKTIGDEIMAVFPAGRSGRGGRRRDAGANLGAAARRPRPPRDPRRLSFRSGDRGRRRRVRRFRQRRRAHGGARQGRAGDPVRRDRRCAVAAHARPRPRDRLADRQGQAGGNRHLRTDLAGRGRGPHVARDAARARPSRLAAAPRHARDRAGRNPAEPRRSAAMRRTTSWSPTRWHRGCTRASSAGGTSSC